MFYVLKIGPNKPMMSRVHQGGCIMFKLVLGGYQARTMVYRLISVLVSNKSNMSCGKSSSQVSKDLRQYQGYTCSNVMYIYLSLINQSQPQTLIPKLGWYESFEKDPILVPSLYFKIRKPDMDTNWYVQKLARFRPTCKSYWISWKIGIKIKTKKFREIIVIPLQTKLNPPLLFVYVPYGSPQFIIIYVKLFMSIEMKKYVINVF